MSSMFENFENTEVAEESAEQNGEDLALEKKWLESAIADAEKAEDTELSASLSQMLEKLKASEDLKAGEGSETTDLTSEKAFADERLNQPFKSWTTPLQIKCGKAGLSAQLLL